ncbi:MFS transporter [Micromonospora sp. STR1s_5]|nr:MFS transporter [Micromonospora sp. STR1s_5]
MKSYLSFIGANWRFLAFGALLTALSSFGQTYFVALFGPEFRAAFELSDGALGTAYALGTVLSALTLSWVGRLIDRTTVVRYTWGVGVLLATACLVAAVAPGVATLVLAFYLLRLGGQGLMTHTAMTVTARAFPSDAGKAVGVAALGVSVASAVLPPVAVLLIAQLGWRWTWGVSAVVVLAGTAVALRFLPCRAGTQVAAQPEAARDLRSDFPLWRDRRLWLSLPVVLASPFISTGFFFHQARLAQEKGWTLGWVAGWFSAFALTQAFVQFSAGPFIDRLGPRRILPICLLPQALAMLTLSVFDAPWSTPVYLILTGISAAITSTLATALWVAYYGPDQLARVRSAVAGLAVLASGASPTLMGLLVDAGLRLDTQAAACFVYILCASLVATRA